MCPACLATMALVATGTTSVGGLTALVVKKIRGKTGEKSGKPPHPKKGEKK